MEYTYGLTARSTIEEMTEHMHEARRMFKVTGRVKPDCPYVQIGTSKVRQALAVLKTGQKPEYSPLMDCKDKSLVAERKEYESHVAEFSTPTKDQNYA